MTEHDDLNTQEVEVDPTEVAIQEAFTDAVETGKAEDDVKLAMISAGATFKNVTRLYNSFMIDAGLAISKTDRDAAIAEIVGENVADLAQEGFYNICVENIVEKIKGATDRAAGAMLRAFAKAHAVDCFKKPKSESTRQDGFRFKLYAALRANPRMTEAECKAFMDVAENGASDNDKKAASHFQGIRKLVNDTFEAAQAE